VLLPLIYNTREGMMKKSFRDHMIEKNPELGQRIGFYEQLGVMEPVLWAQSEIDGRPAIAQCLLRQGLLQEICAKAGQSWRRQILEEDTCLENREIIEEAQEAIKSLTKLGVSEDLLTPIIRFAQATAVKNIGTLLDLGARIMPHPQLSSERLTSWKVCAQAADGSILGPLGDISPLLNDPKEL
jgi:hypothetical protein